MYNVYMKKKWKIAKIQNINYIIWSAFIVSFIYKIVSSVLINQHIWEAVDHFDLFNMRTWRWDDYILTISGAILVLELIALMKTRGVDIVRSAEEIKNIYQKDEGEEQ